MATILNRSAPGQPTPQPPQQPQMPDPVQMLLDEYSRLEEKATPKPMYTPEQANQRVDQNNELAELGIIGQMSGDRRSQQMGGSVLRQALAARQERVSQRGTQNPLTGEETISPEYQAQQAESKRSTILNKAMGMLQARQMQQERIQQQQRHDEFMGSLRTKLQGMRDENGGSGHNNQRVRDETTGIEYWVDPRDGSNKGPVKLPDGSPMGPKPLKMTANDEKSLSEIVRQAASVESALASIKTTPKAFGMGKGMIQNVPGVLGMVAQASRDKSMSNDELAARALVYNNVSQIIKDRAGTAQSAGEIKRLNSFLPSDMDDAPRVMAKLTAFKEWLAEQGSAIQGRYKGERPTLHADPESGVPSVKPPAASVAPAGGGKTRMRYNPATGELE